MTLLLRDYTLAALKARQRTGDQINQYSRKDFNYGVTEISYTVGSSGGFQIFCDAGTHNINALICDESPKYENLYLYFDTSTEEFLGETRNDAAYKLNYLGQYWESKHYEKAKDYFYKAYQLCSRGSKHEATYKNNFKLAVNKIKAIAQAKEWMADMNKAEQLYKEGIEHMNSENYEEAMDCFYQAYSLCPSDCKNKRIYKKNLKLAEDKLEELRQAELDRIAEKRRETKKVIKLKNWGLEYMTSENYEEARDCFHPIYLLSPTSSKNEKKYHKNLALAEEETEELRQAELDRIAEKRGETKKAIKLKNWGLEYMTSENYEEARDCFHPTYLLCPTSSKNEKKYHKNLALAEEIEELRQAELARVAAEAKKVAEKTQNDAKRAEMTLAEGIKLFDEAWLAEETDAEKANELFKVAQAKFDQCSKYLKDIAKKFSELVALKIQGNANFNNGLQLHDEGIECYKADKFDEALTKYERSLKHFEQAIVNFSLGLKMGEPRFKDSIEFVQKCLSENQELVQHVVYLADEKLTRQSKVKRRQSQYSDAHFQTPTLVIDS